MKYNRELGHEQHVRFLWPRGLRPGYPAPVLANLFLWILNPSSHRVHAADVIAASAKAAKRASTYWSYGLSLRELTDLIIVVNWLLIVNVYCLMMSRDPGSEVVTNDNRMHLHQMGSVQPRWIQFAPTAFGTKNPKFQSANWFNKYTWLENYETFDALFCFYCWLYGSQGRHVEPEFTETGCRNWKNALFKLTIHNLSKSHLFATVQETILRIDFFVPLLDAVLSSIKTRFSKQATEFMTRITAFSPEN